MGTRPFVFVNMAMTADGKIDTVARSGVRISGPADEARVDRLRASADAIMVGGRTLLAEDPRLSVRDPGLVAERVHAGRPAQPTKVGVVSHLAQEGPDALRPEGDFLGTGDAPIILCTTARTDPATIAALESSGVEVIVAGAQRVDLAAALEALADRGIERLMVEGGGTIAAALLAGDFVDELQLAVAPLLFGGATAPTPVDGSGLGLEAAVRLTLAEVGRSDVGDVFLRYHGPGRPAVR